MHLKPGVLLKSGSYKIEQVLGQGGFGITYLAVQTGLNRKVAVKEFFMKEHCNRDSDTSYVSVPSVGSRGLVEKFRLKFIKEAQTIADMDNQHIVRIHDVFEENGTAYYVMEHLSGGSLSERIPSGGLPESDALNYIRQIGEALAYIHENNILHLDIKPSNILFRKEDEAVLIDFGISKHYDEAGGGQTSSTPVGVSRGYAPLEQNKQGGVSQFSPATDIYALGATLYKLLTGQTPPDADEVNEDGLPPLPSTISVSVCEAIEKAMSPKRKDRPQSVAEFMLLFDAAEGEETLPPPPPDPRSRNLKWLWALLAGIVAAVVMFFVFKDRPKPEQDPVVEPVVSQDAPVVVETPAAPDPLSADWESDLQKYESLVEMGIEYSKNDATLSQAKSKLMAAVSYERKYKNSSYSGKFSKNVTGLLKTVENRQSDLAAAAQAEADRVAQEQKERERREQEQREREQREREEAERKRNEISYMDGILRVQGVEYPMVFVSGGSFDMGATPEQGNAAESDEEPVHRVTLSSYRIGKYEVTQELWEAVMGSNPSQHKGARRPVERVSWDDCQEFIRKLNELTGQSFRLPTEAEWEFAARGGNSSRGYKYSGGDNIGAVAWYGDNSGDTTHNVGTKSANELGLYDMSGNVFEWCSDRYRSYRSSSQTNPRGPSSGSNRVYRGGCWNGYARHCRVSYRGYHSPDFRYKSQGFRLCL